MSMVFRKSSFVSILINEAALKCEISYTTYGAEVPSMNKISMYTFALKRVFPAPIVTWYHCGAFLIFWEGSHVETMYSDF